MELNTYKIRNKKIITASLFSLTSQNWVNYDEKLIPWSGSVYIGPNINEIYYNTNTSSLSLGYYKWSGNEWNPVEKKEVFDSYNIPIIIDSTADEMGVMVGFDGFVEPVDQLCNFSYTQTGNTVQLYNTVNPNKLRMLSEENFTIIWGDGSSDEIEVVNGETLPTISHEYLHDGEYKITIVSQSSWSSDRTEKYVTIPEDVGVHDPYGVFTYTGATISYFNIPDENYVESGRTTNYLNLHNNGNVVENTTFLYASIGKSRIEEKKLYGTNEYTEVSSGSLEDGTQYWDYEIDGLHYRDLSDGYTLISGSTSGFTKEEVFNQAITRNEHFLGFIEDPMIYSDVFIERGKEGVMEKNLRLSEIDNVGEMEIYGNGYFKVRKS
jgi:hypothetical protein